MSIVELIKEIGLDPKRKAACHGGEYCSPCPFCKEGKDRFLIWPNRANKNGDLQGGRFSCRVCGKYGDAITFLMELHGISYKDACERLRIPPRERSCNKQIRTKAELKEASEPNLEWSKKALVFTEWCHERLMSSSGPLKLISSRGINPSTLTNFKLGFCPEDYWRDRKEWGLSHETKENGSPKKIWLPGGIVIPTIQNEKIVKIKIRRTSWKEGDKWPKYVEVSGSMQAPSIFGNTKTNVTIVVESELDAILIQQFASDLCFCVALGGSTKPLDRFTDSLLRNTQNLFFCPDFDKAGAVAWAKWKNLFPHIRRILTPDGKGPGDAYLSGVNLREWISLELESHLRSQTKLLKTNNEKA